MVRTLVSNSLKIVTVNVLERDIDTINNLIGVNGLYPSRSELLRVAVKEFLIKEIRMARSIDNEVEFVDIKDVPAIMDVESKEIAISSEEDGKFVVKTKILGTKEEWLRSKRVIKPKYDPEWFMNETGRIYHSDKRFIENGRELSE